jgi:type I restriction enzyme M protein
MIGAIVGDVAGSRFEWRNIKTKEFDLLADGCRFTDDSVMTLAVCDALLSCRDKRDDLGAQAVRRLQEYGRAYPDAGYGTSFWRWLKAEHPRPYNSWGNGAAMRVSGCGWTAGSVEEAAALSRAVTEVTHNHPEGLKGAEAVAVAVYLARTGADLPTIRSHITGRYYALDFTLDQIRDGYTFDVSCQGSVPQALEAFFESRGFEDAVRNAVSIGGDSDTIAAIAGSVAEAYYGVPADIRQRALAFLDEKLLNTLAAFEEAYPA